MKSLRAKQVQDLEEKDPRSLLPKSSQSGKTERNPEKRRTGSQATQLAYCCYLSL